MPVPSFLASFADQAKATINASPLAGQIPGLGPAPSANDQPSANQAAATSGKSEAAGGSMFKNAAIEQIQHQLRSLGQQYSSASPVQKIITTEKGVAIDFDSISRDAKTQSKELYTWGQHEAEDLKDVTDRLAYLNFVSGSLASSLAMKLDAARTSFKNLRDAEAAATPRRNIRAGLQQNISRVEHDQQKGNESRLTSLKEQLKKAEADDESAEKEIELLKRMAVRQSEQLKWDALREYGEKLVLLSQAAAPIITALPPTPPSKEVPYKGTQATAAARASLQRALDNYKTGHINLPAQSAASELSRSDTQSFGESHASELSSMDSMEHSVTPGLPLTPPLNTASLPVHGATPPSSFKSSDTLPNRASATSPPMNPAVLNNAPAPIPVKSPSSATTAPIAIPDPINPGGVVPTITPTVAETGVPVSAGDKGPGPASGSLLNIKAASPSAGPQTAGLPANTSTPSVYGQTASAVGLAAGAGAAAGSSGTKFESAEEEKKRLQREDRERILAAQGGPSPATALGSTAAPSGTTYETAEAEKKRLEREERERILRQGGSGAPGGPAPPKKDDEDLPPYQDL